MKLSYLISLALNHIRGLASNCCFSTLSRYASTENSRLLSLPDIIYALYARAFFGRSRYLSHLTHALIVNPTINHAFVMHSRYLAFTKQMPFSIHITSIHTHAVIQFTFVSPLIFTVIHALHFLQ